VEDWVAHNPTFMSDVLNSNMMGQGSLVHSSGFPAASGSGPSLNPDVASTPSSSFFQGVGSALEAATAPAEPGEEVQQGAIEALNVAALPGVPQDELFGAISQNLGIALPQVPAAPPAAPIHQDIEPMIQSAKSSIYNNLTTLHGSMDPKEATELMETIFYKKSQILQELERLNGLINGPILWKDGWDTIRNPQSGKEYQPNTLDMIWRSLQRYGLNSDYYKNFLNERVHTMENEKSTKLKLEDLTIAKLDSLNQAKLIVGRLELENEIRIIKKELRYLDFSSMKKVRRHSSARTRVLKSVLHIREDTPAGSEFYRSRSQRTALLQLHRGETQSPWLHVFCML
jgi:hypothetical protein